MNGFIVVTKPKSKSCKMILNFGSFCIRFDHVTIFKGCCWKSRANI